MNINLNPDELKQIEKSNSALEILATLPADQRTILIEGIIAAFQLSKNDARPGEENRSFLWDWWLRW